MNHWYLGTIGFSYKDWVGPFYPAGISQGGYLTHYSKVFNSVELDTTFHAIPRQESVLSWAASTPPEFKFCLKTPRRITHELGLKSAQRLMNEFLDIIQPLGKKLGPILIQLPPRYSQDNYMVLAEFLEYLPKTHQFAIEFRHASWYNAKTAELLSQYHVCWVTIDYPKLPKEIIQTTRFLYIRWIGINNMYHHHTHERVIKTDQLKWWLDLIRSADGQFDTIYGYFNNDYAGFAAGTCKRFKQIAGFNSEDDEIAYQESFL
jgi:uncharacterized protein YecE (DUF72 family)